MLEVLRPAVLFLDAHKQEIEAYRERSVTERRLTELAQAYEEIALRPSEQRGVDEHGKPLTLDQAVMRAIGLRSSRYFEVKALAVARGWSPPE